MARKKSEIARQGLIIEHLHIILSPTNWLTVDEIAVELCKGWIKRGYQEPSPSVGPGAIHYARAGIEVFLEERLIVRHPREAKYRLLTKARWQHDRLVRV